jgi:septum formation protein
MPSGPLLVLASTSPHRKALFGRLGLPFSSAAPGVDEALVPGESPWDRASRLAREKALAVAHQHPEAIIIGGDQVASIGRAGGEDGSALQILRKPGDRATCLQQLQAMSSHTVRFDTALAVVRDAEVIAHLDLTLVRFRALTEREIENYMDREPAFDCAGGFKCEGLGVTLFEAIETRDPTALIGLPLIRVCHALREFGVQV